MEALSHGPQMKMDGTQNRIQIISYMCLCVSSVTVSVHIHFRWIGKQWSNDSLALLIYSDIINANTNVMGDITPDAAQVAGL